MKERQYTIIVSDGDGRWDYNVVVKRNGKLISDCTSAGRTDAVLSAIADLLLDLPGKDRRGR